MEKRRKLKLGNKAVIIFFAVLTAVIIITAAVNMTNNSSSIGGGKNVLTVSGENSAGKTKTIKKYTMKEIRKLESENVYADLESSSKADEKGTFTGVSVMDLLNDSDPNLVKEYKTFIFTAGDGYSSAASQKEIKEKNNIIAAYSKNGKTLTEYSKGGSGPLQVIFAKDTYGNRSTKYLVKIICKK
ncbi:MAG: molybdopterin-dependent oxidoreductase [Eubacteriaceae bacterium]|nr:molybdopterin-dependent oxidoreductase [Eubacteriaceae bacterium]